MYINLKKIAQKQKENSKSPEPRISNETKIENQVK